MNKNVTHKWLPKVSGYCTGCGDCIEVCPKDCLVMEWDFAVLKNAGQCIGQEVCALVCPSQAIQMHWSRCDANKTIGRWSSQEQISVNFIQKMKSFFGRKI